jgi:hypothetical protein
MYAARERFQTQHIPLTGLYTCETAFIRRVTNVKASKYLFFREISLTLNEIKNMKVPNYEQAYIEPDKLTKYLLNFDHPEGAN